MIKLLYERLKQYIYLMRLDKPIGIFLLLWPTLWALWLAGEGQPHSYILTIFVCGVILMRSAGCIINDFWDRKLDIHVKRTANRPLAAGKVTVFEALILALFLSSLAFFLVLKCNLLTVCLAIIGAMIMILYPLMKRFTYLPQIGVGAAFTWSVPMSFAAETGNITLPAWVLFFTGMVWPIIYDTMYAMVDKDDDIKIGIKSTAILFNDMSVVIIALLQLLFLVLLVIVGLMFKLHTPFYYSLILVALLFLYQLWLIRNRERDQCFSAFLNNHFVGLIIFAGILMSYLK